MRVEAELGGWQAFGEQRRLRRLGHANGDVGFPREKVVDPVGQRQLDHQCRMIAPELRQDRRQVLDADHVTGADPHRSCNGAERAAGGAQQRGGGGCHDLC
jgi:hypothetical protein